MAGAPAPLILHSDILKFSPDGFKENPEKWQKQTSERSERGVRTRDAASTYQFASTLPPVIRPSFFMADLGSAARFLRRVQT